MTGDACATVGPVKIIGTGLLGTSIGLGLTTRGVDVTLEDVSPTILSLACGVGAGRPAEVGDPSPTLVIVAAPPDVVASLVIQALEDHPTAVVSDVASVKGVVRDEISRAGADMSRYVGSHPMAGREKSGPTAATADLFVGRPWVLCPNEQTDPKATVRVRELAVDLGATSAVMDADQHDEAVALISHVPQVVSSLMAAQLESGPDQALSLAGQGLRDVTRIAAGDSGLWVQILAANSAAVVPILRSIKDDLDAAIIALETLNDTEHDPAALSSVARTITDGNAGQARIPGKHGTTQRQYEHVTVLVPDKPGELGRLFAEVGTLGINLEDLELEHSPRQPVGLAKLAVLPGEGRNLSQALTDNGWTIAG